MTFPTTQGRFTGVSSTTNATTWAIPSTALPAAGGSNANDLLLIFLSVDGTTTAGVSISSSTNLRNLTIRASVTDAAQVTGHFITGEIAAGGVAPALTFANNAVTEQYSCVVLQMRSSTGKVSLATQSAAYFTSASGSSTNSNPAAFDPDGAARDYTFVASRHGDSTTVATVAPTNYGNLQSQAGGGTTGASTNTAERQLNTAASEDPGTFTSGSEQWVCFTVAVYEEAVSAISTLTDNFDDNAIGAAWATGQLVIGGAASTSTAAETHQRLELSPATAGGYDYNGYVTTGFYNLTNDGVFCSVTNTTGWSASQEFHLSFGDDANNHYDATISGGNLYLQKWIAGAVTNITNVAYSATTHQWIRLRHITSGDTINVDTASNAASDPPLSGDWTNRHSAARDTQIAVTAAKVGVAGGAFAAITPVTFYVDGLNTATGLRAFFQRQQHLHYMRN